MLRDIGIFWKLVLGFFAVSFFLLLTGWFGLQAMSSTSANFQQESEEVFGILDLSSTIVSLWYQVIIQSQQLAIENSGETIFHVEELMENLKRNIHSFEQAARREQETILAKRLQLSFAQLEKNVKTIIDQARSANQFSDQDDQLSFVESSKIKNVAMSEVAIHNLLETRSFVVEETKKFAEDMVASSQKTRRITLFLLVAGLLFSVLVSFLLSYVLSNPLIQLKDTASRIVNGDFEARSTINSKDEIGNLAALINEVADDLKKKLTLEEHEKMLKQELSRKNQRLESQAKELQNKIAESEDIKRAILNIMEDVDETNKELTEAHGKLQTNVKELRKLDLQKDQFISIAAHELKTPLTSIHGFSDLLAKPAVIENPSLRKKYLDIIHKDAKRLGSLITNILELSRMDIGTLKLAWQKVDLEKFMGDIKEQMDIIITQAGYQSQYEIEKGLPKIVIDLDKTFQVVTNLLSNAVKYAGKGTISFIIKKQGDNVLFSVEDTGEGISKEHQEKIFERFYQIESHLVRSQGGTGLGLSLCQGFIEAMGGKIWVISELGKGTKFFFTIPISKTIKKESIHIFRKKTPEDEK